jgi:hypothetical protein
MNILHGIAFLFLKYPYSMILFRMNTAISTIVVIAAALGRAGIVSTVLLQRQHISKVESVLDPIRLS